MTLQQVQICDRLAALGSFNAAARSLGVTQPAVSSSLSQLESELGIRLFLRSRSGILLTAKGKELLPLMREMLGLSTEIATLSAKLPEDRGSLKIAGRQGFIHYVFPSLFERLQRRYPLIHIESVVSSDQEAIVEALATGRVDLAFAADPGMKSIVAERLYRDPVMVCHGGKHPQKGSHAYCLPTQADRLRKPLEKLIRSLDKKAVISLESDDYTLLGSLVASGRFAGPVYGHMLLDPAIRAAVKPIKSVSGGLHRDLTVLYRRDDLMPHVRTAKDLFATETKNLLDSVVG